jgi:hypothetical protein
MRYLITVLLVLHLSYLNAQDNSGWELPIYFSDYPKKYIYLPDTLKLFDTIRVDYDRYVYFKIVFKETKGECYFESYKNNRIYEKGNYINSLDTLKQYTSSRGTTSVLNERRIGKKIFRYFEPLRDGEWVLFTSKGLIRKLYITGVEVKSNK